MSIRKTAVGLVVALALAAGLVSNAAATDYEAKPKLGRAKLEVEFEIERRVRELEIGDAEKIALPNGSYTLNVSITSAAGTTLVLTTTVKLRKGEFKEVKIRQVNTGTLFTVSLPPTSVTVQLTGAGGTVNFPAAAFRKD